LSQIRKFNGPKMFNDQETSEAGMEFLEAATAQRSTQGQKIIDDAFELVGGSPIEFNPNFRDIHLVVGNTGTGKSALVQFIAGDISKLESVRDPPITGRFIIQGNDKISKAGSNTESKTLFPDLVINTTRELAFYDCPGFKDSRGTAVDMAASYMTKKVFSHSHKIKLVICVEYEVATGSAGRAADFLIAIKHVGEFIHDTEKFISCFSMVATKVPKEDDDDGEPFTDEAIITNLGNFIGNDMLGLTKRNLKEAKTERERKILKNSLAVFTGLSSKGADGKYNRIGIFRRPDKKGPLDKVPRMVKCRKGILTAIQEGTQFAAAAKADFGFSVADATKLEMGAIATDVNATIEKEMKGIGEAIRKQVVEHMRTSVDWSDLRDYFHSLKNTLTKVAEKLKVGPKLTVDFIDQLKMTFRTPEMRIHFPPERFRALTKQVGYLDFLETMLGKSLGVLPGSAFDSAVSRLREAIAWYNILYSVYENLATDSIQENRTKYNVASLDDWGRSGRPQGLQISRKTIAQFLSLLKINQDPLESLDLNEERTNELNSVIQLTLAYKANVEVDKSGVLEACGSFIRLSKVMEEYSKNELKKKTISIHASCKVFIDVEEAKAPGVHMLIASPKWEVKGKSTIILAGNKGEANGGIAPDGKGETVGENGAPGGPAQHGGHFVGIAAEVSNFSQLTIKADGGEGGRGQKGGKGGNGTKGIDASHPSNKWIGKPDGVENKDYI